MATMRAPTGETQDVPDSLVAHYQSLGATVVAPAASTNTKPEKGLNYNLDWARGGVNALPAAGATAMGAMGGPTPAAIPLATLGGAGGEAARQLIARFFPQLGLHAPESAHEAIFGDPSMGGVLSGRGGMAGNAAMMGAGQAGGQYVLKPALEALAPLLYRAGIAATPSEQQAFPQMAKQGVEDKIQSGAQAVAGRSASSQTTKGMLRQAGRRGVKFTVDDFAQGAINEAQQSLAEGGHPPLTQQEIDTIRANTKSLANDLLKARRSGAGPTQDEFTPMETKRIAQQAGAARKGKLSGANAQKIDLSASPDDLLRLQRAATAAKNSIPRVAAQEAKTQSYIGLSQALSRDDATFNPLRPNLLGRVAMGGGATLGGLAGMHAGPAGVGLGGVGGAALADLLSTPPVLRAAGIAAANPVTQSAAQQAPSGLYALLQLLFNHQAATPGRQ